jgi:hypothetical protein
VTSALSSHRSAKICHPPVFDYHSGIETTGGKFKKFSHIIIEVAIEYLRVLSKTLVILDAMAVWHLGLVEHCFDRF